MRVLHLIFRSPLSFAAGLSVVMLCGAVVWQTYSAIQSHRSEGSYVATAAGASQTRVDAAFQQELVLLGLATGSSDSSDSFAESDTDPIALIGPMVIGQLLGQYVGLSESGSYSAAEGSSAAEDIAENMRAVVSYKTYSISDFSTDTDTSYERMVVYRSDLRVALEPLLDNDQSELELYGRYVETSDPAHLETLRVFAGRYREAAKNAAGITVPRDAVNYHKDILNAIEQFAATIESMASHADDPFASVALLRTFNSAEEKMFFSFNALSAYYSQKMS